MADRQFLAIPKSLLGHVVMMAGYKIIPPVPGVAAHPAVAIDVAGGIGNVGVTNLITKTSTIAANPNRCLVALLVNGISLTVSGIAYTLGSGTWNKLGSVVAGGGTRNLEIWSSVAPVDSGGSVTIQATHSGNFAVNDDGWLVLYSLYNVDQGTPVDGYASDGGASTVTLSTTVTAGGMMLCQLVSGGGVITPMVTGIQDFTTTNNLVCVAGHNTGSGTVFCTWTNAVNGRGINACNVRAA